MIEASTQHDGRRRARLRASLLLEVAVSPGSDGVPVTRLCGAAGSVQRPAAMAALRSLERDGLVVGGSHYRLSHAGEERLRRFGEFLDEALRGVEPVASAPCERDR